MPTPFLILGDAPSLPTGLGRIARDLAFILMGRQEQFDIDLAVLGLGWNGSRFPFHIYPLEDEDNWGEGDFQRVWEDFAGDQPGIILSVWDPARCFPLAEWKRKRAEGVRRELVPSLWGYFAIDAMNPQEKIGGPAGDALGAYDQVLGYGQWGSGVLARTLGRAKVPWLPHGFHGLNFYPHPGAARKLVGCVASNQARKDLGSLFEVWRALGREHPELIFWLHTDLLTKYWSVPELIEVFGLEERVLVTGVEGGALDDSALRGLYSQCLCTIAPGLGEGFGYPIIESLACGTPVIGIDYAGGAEWIPRPEWRTHAGTWRIDGTYALYRPVFSRDELHGSVKGAIRWMEEEREVVEAYCSGAVAHLEWGSLVGRWVSWFRRCLTMTREGWAKGAEGAEPEWVLLGKQAEEQTNG